MFVGNSIITMIIIGLIANTFLLIHRMESNRGGESAPKKDLILNLLYCAIYLPFPYWLSQNQHYGSDCICRIKNFISMLFLMLTHFIVLDHLGQKFIKTLKTLKAEQTFKDSYPLIQ